MYTWSELKVIDSDWTGQKTVLLIKCYTEAEFYRLSACHCSWTVDFKSMDSIPSSEQEKHQQFITHF